MDFYIVDYPAKHPPADAVYPCIVLTKDNWDDFGYSTLFSTYFFPRAGNYFSYDLGYIKIIARGQRSGYTPNLKSHFTELDQSFCSLGQTLKYYRILLRLKRNWQGKTILQALRDAAYDAQIAAAFEAEDGFEISLLRFTEARKALKEGRNIFDETVVVYENLEFKFTMCLDGASTAHEIKFDFIKHAILPYRFNVLVGRNGTGKTALLGGIANSLCKHDSSNYGFEPVPLVSRVLAISYSALDNFRIPTESNNDLMSYKYCGLRRYDKEVFCIDDEDGDVRLYLGARLIHEKMNHELSKLGVFEPKLVTSEVSSSGRCIQGRNATIEIQYDHHFVKGYCERVIAPVELLDRVDCSIKEAVLLKRTGDLKNVLSKVLYDADRADSFINSESARGSIFQGLSAGQRFAVAIVCDVCGFLEKESLVLFDEPETHLHPGLLSTLLSALYDLLEAFNSFAIISTHSPVILQQVPSRSVKVFRRESNTPYVDSLKMECFGADIQSILSEVLDLAEPELDYHDTLKKMAAKMNMDEIDRMFDGRLSLQAQIYVNSLHVQKETCE